MSDDLTRKLPGDKEPTAPQDDDRITILISAVQLLSTNFQSLSTNVQLLSTNFQSLSTNFQSLSTNFQSLSTKVEEVEVRLEALEKTVTERSFETKPIWERALAEIAATRGELAETRAELKAEMKDGFRKLAVKIQLLTEDSLTVRGDQRQLERRVETLESKTP